MWLDADVDVDVDGSPGGGVTLARASFGVGDATGDGDGEMSCCWGERARLKDAIGEKEKVSGVLAGEVEYARKAGMALVRGCILMAGRPDRRSSSSCDVAYFPR